MALSDEEVQGLFLRWYAGEYPAREHMIAEQAVSIADGWETEVYSISLAYEEAGTSRHEDLILRLYHGASGVAKADREFHGMRRLAIAGYPVPRVQSLALGESPFGRPCMTMERIAGRNMGDAFGAASKEEQQRLLTQFCRLFVDLHALDWRPFVPEAARIDPDAAIASWLLRMRDAAARLQVHALDPLVEWLEGQRTRICCTRCAVVHGDFHPYNVLLRDDGSPAVIDWTTIDLSDYRFDLAWTLLLVGTFGRPELRRPVLAEYERLAEQPIEHLAFFDAAACLRRLGDLYVTLTQDATHLGMRPEAATIMRGQIPHFRAVYALLQERTGLTLPEIERLLM